MEFRYRGDLDMGQFFRRICLVVTGDGCHGLVGRHHADDGHMDPGMRRALLAASLALLAGTASAQTSPNLTQGQVPTVAQWNGFFTGKQDFFTGSPGAYGTLTCDGATDNTATIAAFSAAGGGLIPRPTTLPAYLNYCKTTTGRASFTGPYSGAGRIGDSAGHLLGPTFYAISTQPTQLGTFSVGSVATAFDADSKSPLAIEARLTGTALSTATGTGSFVTTPNAYPIQTFLYSSAGNQNGNDGTGSRTGAYTWWGNIYADSAGGDTYMSHCQGFFAQHNAAATTTFANGAIGCHDGQLTAGQDGQILELLGDFNAIDNGHDISAYMLVGNTKRTNSAGALGASWMNRRVQAGAGSTKPIDAVDSVKLPIGIGMDYAGATFPDQVLAGNPTIAAPGTGYTAGDPLTAAGGTCNTATVLRVLTVDGGGGVTSIGLDRAGKCSVVPASPNGMTGGSGSGFQANLVYKGGAVLAMPPNTAIHFNAVQDTSVFGAGFPTVTKVGTTSIGYSTSLGAINVVVNNASAIQASSTQVSVPKDLLVIGTFQINPAILISALPTCNAGAEGSWRAVSDATAPTYNATLTGGGTVHIPVYCDGTNWRAH